MNSDRRCRTCDHLFHTCHLEDDRLFSYTVETSNGRCEDCTACLDPDDVSAPRERPQAVPA